jgi:hypothetical protein
MGLLRCVGKPVPAARTNDGCVTVSAVSAASVGGTCQWGSKTALGVHAMSVCVEGRNTARVQYRHAKVSVWREGFVCCRKCVAESLHCGGLPVIVALQQQWSLPHSLQLSASCEVGCHFCPVWCGVEVGGE